MDRNRLNDWLKSTFGFNEPFEQWNPEVEQPRVYPEYIDGCKLHVFRIKIDPRPANI